MTLALYYPHTDIRNEAILKNALLLWDGIETISPTDEWAPLRFKNKAANEAVDMLVKPRKPGVSEQNEAHEALKDIQKSGLLAELVTEWPEVIRQKPYLVYPEKFSMETWYLLQEHGLARWSQTESDYGVPAACGFLMMSLLADACAGSQILKVTDRADAYSWLSSRTATVLSGGRQRVDAAKNLASYERLVSLSLEVLDARDIPLADLVAFRKRELKQGGSDLGGLRKKYLELLQAHLKRITTEARTDNDVKDLERQFKRDLKRDLDDLRVELNQASWKALMSKEVAMSVVISAGALITPAAALIGFGSQIGGAGVIPLVKTAIDLRGARKAAFQKHSSSWLYLAKQKGLQIR